MLTDVQRSKLQNRFGWLDADGDGYIEQSDFELLVSRIWENVIPDDHPEEREVVRKGYMDLWTHLLVNADADSDYQISLDEYMAAVENGIMANPSNYENSLGAAIRALFDALDSNHDGKVSGEEFAPMASSFGLKPEQFGAVFDLLDADKDGSITLEEFLNAVKDFYFGDTLESAGGQLFGQDAASPTQTPAEPEPASAPETPAEPSA